MLLLKLFKLGHLVQQTTYVIDLAGMNTSLMWKPGLEMFQHIAKVVEQHTPEILYKVYVINGLLTLLKVKI